MADVPTLSITLLGAGQEVGRSCCVLQYRNITLVLDAGVHPAHTGMASLPFIDELDWSTVDAILITQCVPLSVQNLGSIPIKCFSVSIWIMQRP
jgi:predicted metal-dependent RNase